MGVYKQKSILVPHQIFLHSDRRNRFFLISRPWPAASRLTQTYTDSKSYFTPKKPFGMKWVSTLRELTLLARTDVADHSPVSMAIRKTANALRSVEAEGSESWIFVDLSKAKRHLLSHFHSFV